MRRYWNKEVRFRCDFYHYSPESAAFDLGLERAGMRCVGQVEIEPFCQKVLAKHWPDVWRWNDVKTLTGETVRQHCETVDLLCGGVPCQPASVAGKRKGAADHRWLWPDFLRLVSEVNPVWVLAENPRGVFSIDVEGVQFSEWIAREFAARGYELLPVELAAENVGAPHRRERIFFLGRRLDDAGRKRLEARWTGSEQTAIGEVLNDQPERASAADLAHANGNESERRGRSGNVACASRASEGNSEERERLRDAAGDCNSDVANADSPRLQERGQSGINGAAQTGHSAAAARGGYQWPARPGQPQYDWEEPRTIELPMGGTVAGLPVRLARRHRVSALKALGNAIVPQVAEVIGRAIGEFNRQWQQGILLKIPS